MKYELLIDERKIIVAAQIKGVSDYREFPFIIDTGASKTVINEDVVTRLGFDIKKLNIGNRLMTAGGGVYSKTLNLPKLSLFGKDIADFEVNVLKIPPQILYFADGFIGMDFLLQFKNINFDFDKKIIETSL